MILWVVSVMYAWNVDHSIIIHRELDLKGKRNMLFGNNWTIWGYNTARNRVTDKERHWGQGGMQSLELSQVLPSVTLLTA